MLSPCKSYGVPTFKPRVPKWATQCSNDLPVIADHHNSEPERSFSQTSPSNKSATKTPSPVNQPWFNHRLDPPQSQACPQPLRIRCQDKSRRTKGPEAWSFSPWNPNQGTKEKKEERRIEYRLKSRSLLPDRLDFSASLTTVENNRGIRLEPPVFIRVGASAVFLTSNWRVQDSEYDEPEFNFPATRRKYTGNFLTSKSHASSLGLSLV